HDGRRKLAHLFENPREVHLEADDRGSRAAETEKPTLDVLAKIEADGAHVSDDLRLRLLEREVDRVLSTLTGSVDEVRARARLSCSRRSRDEDAGPSEIA